MYLSRLYLNPRNRRVRDDISDCREMHRTVLRAFPRAPEGAAPGDTFGVLYRLEQDGRGRIRLLVQSSQAPQWSPVAAVEGYLDPRAPGANPDVKEVGRLYAALRTGQTLRFRLRANPTRKVDTRSREDGQRRNGRRVALTRDTDQLAWLTRKGEAGGFTLVPAHGAPGVPNVRAVPENLVIGNRRQDGKSMTFGSVLFEGLLHVTNPDCFRRTLQEGIGSGKAYGFGLLSIAPA
ncbi:MAG: type I-E CRISPR-associated protein Cas6/Cse3/CasE [Chloroflexi bacterium]|nr:type I-E CRISPR-associated protein Cas6/Cse3/CasE [Chloroflexota bacterium]